MIGADLPTASDETGGGGGNSGGEHGGNSCDGSTDVVEDDEDVDLLFGSEEEIPDPMSSPSVSESTCTSILIQLN